MFQADEARHFSSKIPCIEIFVLLLSFMFLRAHLSKQRFSFQQASNHISKLSMSSSAADDLKKPILALPSTADETVNVDINDTYKLKELGPVGKSQ